MLTSDISFPGDSAIDLTAESKYGIAAKLSSQCFTSKTEDVVIVSGENDFDFALANSLAGSLNAPILVAQNEHVPDVTFQELARLNPKNVILITSDEKIGTNIGPQIKHCFPRILISTLSPATIIPNSLLMCSNTAKERFME
mgnify:CR=1 FL=1